MQAELSHRAQHIVGAAILSLWEASLPLTWGLVWDEAGSEWQGTHGLVVGE